VFFVSKIVFYRIAPFYISSEIRRVEFDSPTLTRSLSSFPFGSICELPTLPLLFLHPPTIVPPPSFASFSVINPFSYFILHFSYHFLQLLLLSIPSSFAAISSRSFFSQHFPFPPFTSCMRLFFLLFPLSPCSSHHNTT